MSARLSRPLRSFRELQAIPLPAIKASLHSQSAAKVLSPSGWFQNPPSSALSSRGLRPPPTKASAMEKGNGGEKKPAAAVAVAAEDGGAKKVEVADGGDKNKPAAPEAPVCFKKTVGDDASVIDATKDYFKQLKVTDADTHWGCIKNRVRLAREYVADKTGSVFGKKKVEPEVKVDGTPAPAAAAVEEGAKPAAAPATGGESH
ncbi:uncharacterized protein LOC124697295 [Lolium rigidum]|uniref:uncharacterized protein LOC124697295 n=1 Tax=Lolium rigidum TaxID=89674 RepID=UPI001F5E28EB|nr:uncharacterized protein LOC124697295 [Lolium rigidum]